MQALFAALDRIEIDLTDRKKRHMIEVFDMERLKNIVTD